MPKTVSLGHVDLRFTVYQQTTNPPAVQVTLLKQQTNGFGYRSKSRTSKLQSAVAVDAPSAPPPPDGSNVGGSDVGSDSNDGGSARCRVNSSERKSGERKIADSLEFNIDWQEASGECTFLEK